MHVSSVIDAYEKMCLAPSNARAAQLVHTVAGELELKRLGQVGAGSDWLLGQR
jgi:hypothetical protein